MRCSGTSGPVAVEPVPHKEHCRSGMADFATMMRFGSGNGSSSERRRLKPRVAGGRAPSQPCPRQPVTIGLHAPPDLTLHSSTY
eukprot:9424764-Pyramimonas_sp.AAC.1